MSYTLTHTYTGKGLYTCRHVGVWINHIPNQVFSWILHKPEMCCHVLQGRILPLVFSSSNASLKTKDWRDYPSLPLFQWSWNLQPLKRPSTVFRPLPWFRHQISLRLLSVLFKCCMALASEWGVNWPHMGSAHPPKAHMFSGPGQHGAPLVITVGPREEASTFYTQ